MTGYYRKKPVTVQAWEVQKGERPYWVEKAIMSGRITLRQDTAVTVGTPRGMVQGRAGDYVIKTADNDLQSIKRETFEETYERIERN